MNKLKVNNQNSKLASNLLPDLYDYSEGALIDAVPRNTFEAYRSDAHCINEFFELVANESVINIDEVQKKFYLITEGISQEMLVAYIAYVADKKPVISQKGEVLRYGMSYASITHRVAFISHIHKENNIPSPYTSNIKKFLKAVKKRMGRDGKHIHANQAKKINVFDLKEGVDDVIKSAKIKLRYLQINKLNVHKADIRRNKIKLTALRDRTLLLLGFTGMFRRAELAALKYEQLEFGSNQLFIHMTDQDSKTSYDYKKHIPAAENTLYCPIAALRQYLKVTGITDGYLFYRIRNKGLDKSGKHLSDKTVARLIKTHIGTDKSGHSLRIGMAVAMYEAGIPIQVIMNNGGWKTEAMLWRYIKQYNIAKHNKSVL